MNDMITPLLTPYLRSTAAAIRRGAVASITACVLMPVGCAAAEEAHSQNLSHLPLVGETELRVLSPTLLELTLITTKQPDPAITTEWNFVTKSQKPELPKPSEFIVTAGTNRIGVTNLGFKRRPVYAPLKQRDLRIGNHLYLELEKPISDNAAVEVKSKSGILPQGKKFAVTAATNRLSPVIHVNQEGYLPQFAKRAFVGEYLGSLGEMTIRSKTFRVISERTGKPAFEGELKPIRDVGFDPATYQNVLEADFSSVKEPGEYRIHVQGLGVSLPFFINEGSAATFARAYALGLYHQRCGTDNSFPYTRFVHGVCHAAKAEVPDMKFETANAFLADMSGNFSSNDRHKAPQLKNVDASLYPFVTKGKIDVSGGHHDAGDYSKYTINSAQLIHALVFAADNFPGVGALDNLGLPESGDGKSDLLQEAKWEADFLAKMQDADGGFYFLVYPKDRSYEHDVLPDKGDPQVVFPKTTAATAAAVAALAQTGSSPLFRKQFPEAATNYLAKARKGWEFLEKAIAKYGQDGAYQKITHYGDEFMHDDELIWAATEMFAATGDEKVHKKLIAEFKPNDRETRRWTWWKMFESYGCAIRSYALAAKSGRLKEEKLDGFLLRQCEDELISAAKDQLDYSNDSAYGTSFPRESKRFRSAGWYFSSDRAFDLAAACALDFPEKNDPRPSFIDAIVANLSYEAGCNPVNVSYISGLGWKRPREMVHHVAQNDRQAFPPSGLIWGNIQEGFPFLDPYQKELGALCFPPDWEEKAPYPFYDRWGDTFNTSQEFVVPNLARALATSAYLMAKTSLPNQVWRPSAAQITGIGQNLALNQKVVAKLQVAGCDFGNSRVVWELSGSEPVVVGDSDTFTFTTQQNGPQWIEVEAHLPDGRRVFASANFTVNEKK